MTEGVAVLISATTVSSPSSSSVKEAPPHAPSLDPLHSSNLTAMDETKDSGTDDLAITPEALSKEEDPPAEPAPVMVEEGKEQEESVLSPAEPSSHALPVDSTPPPKAKAADATASDDSNEAQMSPPPVEDVFQTPFSAPPPLTAKKPALSTHGAQTPDNSSPSVDVFLTPANATIPSTISSAKPVSSGNVQTLDRAQEVAVSDLDEAKTPDSYSGAVAEADDGDSSNDDSSYFADPSNLPSPKSGGRKYSFSSSQSNPHPLVSHPASGSVGAARESDASLSLSESDDEGEEDDDDNHSNNNNSDSAMYPTPRGTPDVYPHRITRVHSVGSLISTSSQNSDEPMIHNELNDVTAGSGGYIPGEIPSGRLSPVQALNFGTPTSQMTSPPPIMPYHFPYQPQNFPHPTAQPGSAEDWVAAMANQHQGEMIAQRGSVATSGSGWSEGSPLNYSDDGEMHAFQQNLNQKNSQSKKASSSDRSTPRKQLSGRSTGGSSRASGGSNAVNASSRTMSDGQGDDDSSDDGDRGTYQVYWQRWIMLLYMSVLNLLSDWTCYSVAPIALLTQQAFGNINPEELVVVFLGANAVATACEPIILSRLGLRRTVLFGALLLMVGSIVKSGGMPPIIQADLKKGSGEWRVYLGFFLVGLSQPLYQCTPALLSASWFPEKERTMATGVALNANQLGIGFAFIFGTLLVAESDDIPNYFGLLSQISTITFFGALFQFADAPPTPPSQTARVVRGDLDIRLPSVRQVLESIGLSGREEMRRDINAAVAESRGSGRNATSGKKSPGSKRKSKTSSSGKGQVAKVSAPSSAPWDDSVASAPSPMMPGTVGPPGAAAAAAAPASEEKEEGQESSGQQAPTYGSYPYSQSPYYGVVPPPPPHIGQMGYPMYPGMPYNPSIPSQSPYADSPQTAVSYGNTPPIDMPYGQPYGSQTPGNVPYSQDGSVPPPPFYGYTQPGYPPYPVPFYDQQSGQYVYPPPPPPQFYASPQGYYGSPYGQAMPGLSPGLGGPYAFDPRNAGPSLDEGAEPVLTVTPHHLDIDIRDDQVLLSIRACAARPGFIHALVSFTVSGIVINTLSTFMDYLVRLNGAGREMTGIVGGTFQFVIMISSLIIGGMTDRSRAYYSVTVGMLVLGAFGLAECGVSLNSDRGSDLRLALVIVAVLVGPLQPVSTELGVEVVYPLSENTVLVIQQLFSNLLSALFIPCFKKMKDIGINQIDTSIQQPEYTFSFYLLIVLHAGATVFFATFNGRYLRYEHELRKKEEQERKEEERAKKRSYNGVGEKQPLIQHPLV